MQLGFLSPAFLSPVAPAGDPYHGDGCFYTVRENWPSKIRSIGSCPGTCQGAPGPGIRGGIRYRLIIELTAVVAGGSGRHIQPAPRHPPPDRRGGALY